MANRFYGLIPGRHELPNVTGYVFPATIDPMDFDTMASIVADFLHNVPLDGAEANASVSKGVVGLDVYVTGLTAATAALISGCAANGVKLTLWHFDRDSGDYKPQPVL